MALTWVRVVRPAGAVGGNDIYVNANYIDVAGTVADPPFQVETGQNTFETLNGSGLPEWRAIVIVALRMADDPHVVVLAPVVP